MVDIVVYEDLLTPLIISHMLKQFEILQNARCNNKDISLYPS
jgi:hypothetical protein